MVPALLVQLALFGTAFVGFGLIAEYRGGVIERMRVTPVSRSALLPGRSLRDVVVLTVQGALLIALAVPFGLRTPVGGAALGLVLVAVLGLAMSSASHALALRLTERGCVRAGAEFDHRAVVAALRHSAADVAGACLAVHRVAIQSRRLRGGRHPRGIRW